MSNSSLIAGLVVLALLGEPAVAEPVSSDRSLDVRLDLVIDPFPNALPVSFRVRLTNVSPHTVVGGPLRLVFVVSPPDNPQTTAAGPTLEWGEFRLGPGETTTREVKANALVFEDDPSGRWNRSALVNLLERWNWALYASAADKTGPTPGAVWVSQVYQFGLGFTLCRPGINCGSDDPDPNWDFGCGVD
jgi:hypothetical protein